MSFKIIFLPSLLTLVFLFHTGCKPPEPEKNLGKFCVLIHHCGVWKKDDNESIGACVETIEREAAKGRTPYDDRVINCVITAGNDCSRVYTCLNGGHHPEPCEDTVYQNRCQGDVAVSCSERGLVSYDNCRRYRKNFSLPFDYHCLLADRFARCEPPPCQGSFFVCNNNYLVWCEDEELSAEDCGIVYGSAICEESKLGGARCVGTGAPCQKNEKARCEDDNLVYCLGGKEARYDCSSIGSDYTCKTVDEEGVCTGWGDECFIEPEEDIGGDSCRGPMLRYCHAGYRKKVNCRGLGFNLCAWRPDREAAWCE